MRQTYLTASRVVIYLGEEADGSEVAMKAFNAQIVHVKHPKSDEHHEPEVQAAVHSLLKRPYFFRTWVIQEVMLAYKAVMICGDNTIDWTAMERVFESKWLKRRQEISTWMTQTSDTELINKSIESRLMQFLETSKFCLAEDPRDKIFGILGVVGIEDPDAAIQPDYSLSVQEVYTGVAAYLVQQYRERIIYYALAAPKQIPNLPSWVPDWTRLNRLENPQDLVIYINTSLQSISPWYASTLGEPVEENNLEIIDRELFARREIQMLELGDEIWGGPFDSRLIVPPNEDEQIRKNIFGYTKIGSLNVWSSLLFRIDQEGRLQKGQNPSTTPSKRNENILYYGKTGSRLEKDTEIRWIPDLGGVFHVKRHGLENTISLMQHCSIKISSPEKTSHILKNCFGTMMTISCLIDKYYPAQNVWYTLQLRNMCAEIHRISSWRKTMEIFTDARKNMNLRSERGDDVSSPPAPCERVSMNGPKPTDRNLYKLHTIWGATVTKLDLDKVYSKESEDTGEELPTTEFAERIEAKYFKWWDLWDWNSIAKKLWATECMQSEESALVSCAEHLSTLDELLVQTITFERLVKHCYHYDEYLYDQLFSRPLVRDDDGGWKWKSWF